MGTEMKGRQVEFISLGCRGVGYWSYDRETLDKMSGYNEIV